MSRTYSLVCKGSGLKMWVGQGYGAESERGLDIYTDEEHLGRLRRFLQATEGHAITLHDSEYEPDGLRRFENDGERPGYWSDQDDLPPLPTQASEPSAAPGEPS